MNCWKLTVLGASSTITPEGDSNACLHLGNGEQSIVIDAGGNIPALMRETNLDYRNITDLIITHSHPDHTYGLVFLSHAFYNDFRQIQGFSPAEAIGRLKESLSSFDLDSEERYLDIDFTPVKTEKNDTISISDDISIQTLPTKHSRPGFGLKISGGGQTIVYSSDTAPSPPITAAASGADILIHDCQSTNAYRRYFKNSHTSALELGNIARQANVSCLVPFHYNTTELPQNFHTLAEEIREVYKGTIIEPRKGIAFFL